MEETGPKTLIPRLMSRKEVKLIYGIGERDLQYLMSEGRLLSIEVSPPVQGNKTGKRVIYDPAWSLSYGGSLISVEHAHVLRASEVSKLIGVIPRTVRYYSARRIMGYKKVGKHRMYSLLNVREALAWRERHEGGKKNAGARQWMLQWAREALKQPPGHPLLPTKSFPLSLYPTAPMPRATLKKA